MPDDLTELRPGCWVAKGLTPEDAKRVRRWFHDCEREEEEEDTP